MDIVCQRVLNQGFYRADRLHSKCLKKVKAQLPRRESERRNHPLARHCDILTAIETRLSLLNMTFMKYVDMNLCCFIPGKVLDEILKVLRYLETTKNPPRAHEILQELRDISSMAMEYFDEQIVPGLKLKLQDGKFSVSPRGSTSQRPRASLSLGVSGSTTMSPSLDLMQLGVHTYSESEIPKSTATLQSSISKLTDELKSVNRRLTNCKMEQYRQKMYMQIKLREFRHENKRQNRKIKEMNRKLVEYDVKIADLTERLCRSDESASSSASRPVPVKEEFQEPKLEDFLSTPPNSQAKSRVEPDRSNLNTSNNFRTPTSVFDEATATPLRTGTSSGFQGSLWHSDERVVDDSRRSVPICRKRLRVLQPKEDVLGVSKICKFDP